jgi:formylglycine-generating enzyme
MQRRKTRRAGGVVRGLIWFTGAALCALGCRGLLGIEDGTLGEGGAGGESSPGVSGMSQGAASSSTGGGGGTLPEGGAGAGALTTGGMSGGTSGGLTSEGGTTTAGGEAGGGGEGGGLPPVMVCTPNSTVCEGNAVKTCDAEGLGFDSGVACSATQTCAGGECENHECEPKARFCSGAEVRLCADNGLSSSTAEACGQGKYCDSASATCKTGVCAANQPACDGNRATTCNAQGSGYAAGGTTCKSNETCQAGQCKSHVCTPKAGFCQGQTVKTCSDDGLSSTVTATCTNQTCVETGSTASCQGVCAPGQFTCAANALGRQSCGPSGQWGTAVPCVNQACPAGKTACEGECTPNTKKCLGNGVQTCSAQGLYGSAVACPASTPICGGNGVCRAAQPSCNGLTANCGNGSTSCCATASVPAGTYNRGKNNAAFPAKLSALKMDLFEVTVGRFRKFVGAYTNNSLIPAGAGKNPSNATDPGWKTEWNASLPADATALRAELSCASWATWTDTAGANENKPISCVSWYVAAAFCAWDGGRLPTETEWEYVATGGSEQRNWPWGETAPGPDADLAAYMCYYGGGSGTCSSVTRIANVGVIPAGNGRWGNSDMAGNMWEWGSDYYGELKQELCDNCMQFNTNANRVMRGGGWSSEDWELQTWARSGLSPTFLSPGASMRCVYAP